MTLTIADRVEIQELFARFSLAVDVEGPEAMGALFVEDATFVFPGMGLDLRGRDNIVAWVKDNAALVPPGLTHVQSNFVIDGDGVSAQVRCVSQALQTVEGESKIFAVGRYVETVVKTEAGWRLKDHRLDLMG
ncbi:nuclear transport factor 2 family protein [uncultured Shimia sp.]|uniref:nuclear transport factor 2 family protein n=1 Tax=uncultured Shimia sp. TaxID=573152 RepID=UPI0026005CDC|nr:nuclear transport factor 2 family protein [uncultured Shimia sp.]